MHHSQFSCSIHLVPAVESTAGDACKLSMTFTLQEYPAPLAVFAQMQQELARSSTSCKHVTAETSNCMLPAWATAFAQCQRTPSCLSTTLTLTKSTNCQQDSATVNHSLMKDHASSACRTHITLALSQPNIILHQHISLHCLTAYSPQLRSSSRLLTTYT